MSTLENGKRENDTYYQYQQVNNWFINARRRILQPMLDSAHATHTGPASLQPDVDYAPKRMLLSGAGSSSGPGSDGEDALSYGDSDQ